MFFLSLAALTNLDANLKFILIEIFRCAVEFLLKHQKIFGK